MLCEITSKSKRTKGKNSNVTDVCVFSITVGLILEIVGLVSAGKFIIKLSKKK